MIRMIKRKRKLRLKKGLKTKKLEPKVALQKVVLQVQKHHLVAQKKQAKKLISYLKETFDKDQLIGIENFK